MTIHFFTIDPQTGVLYAGCKAGGKRFTAAVWSQGGSSYVTSGARLTNDLERHSFSGSQERTLQSFLSSGAQNLEIWEGIA